MEFKLTCTKDELATFLDSHVYADFVALLDVWRNTLMQELIDATDIHVIHRTQGAITAIAHVKTIFNYFNPEP